MSVTLVHAGRRLPATAAAAAPSAAVVAPSPRPELAGGHLGEVQC
jgi:hypothetical protein